MLIDTILTHLPDDNPSQVLADGLLRSARFQVDNVVRYLHDDWGLGRTAGRTPFRIEDRIPNVAPLAPAMWFEYSGAAIGGSSREQFGCILSIDYDRDHTNLQAHKYQGVEVPAHIRWILRAEYFHVIEPFQGISSSDWIYYIQVGNDGQSLGVTEQKSFRVTQDTPQDYSPDEQQRQVWHEEIVAALLAICFAHCKGTEIEEHPPSRQVRRAAERKKEPMFSFYTIDVRPTARVLREEGSTATRSSTDGAEQGIARALHICRGHFAHYTDEHPLFGKYTGTFYRPMHLRGSVEQGVVVKDYRSHPVPEGE